MYPESLSHLAGFLWQRRVGFRIMKCGFLFEIVAGPVLSQQTGRNPTRGHLIIVINGKPFEFDFVLYDFMFVSSNATLKNTCVASILCMLLNDSFL